MKVENEIAYHIHRIGKYDEYWKVGNEILFGKTKTNLEKLTNESRIDNEDSFEKIRGDYYSTKPSRSKCIFVCNKGNTESWYNHLTKQKESSDLKPVEIFEVELCGNLYWADASIYEDYWKSKDVQLIHNYWQDIINQDIKLEGLFVGQVKVLRRCVLEDFEIKPAYMKGSIKIISSYEEPSNEILIDFEEYQ